MANVLLNLEDAAKFAVTAASATIKLVIESTAGRKALHVVILDPRIPYIASAELPILYEATIGEQDPTQWSSNFKEIAHSKARVCWRTGMSTRTVGENAPYLYHAGDTKYPGGVVCDGLIVAASGLPWQMDEACAHTIIAFLWAKVRGRRDRMLATEDQLVVE